MSGQLGESRLPVTAVVVIAAVAAAVFTTLVSVGAVAVQIRNPAAHLVLETANGLIALLVAYLIFGRFRRRFERRDLLISQGLTLLAAAGLTATGLLLSGASALDGKLYVWLPLTLRVVGATGLAAGALTRGSRVVQRRWRSWGVVLPLVICLLTSAALGSVAQYLPMPINPKLSPASAPPASLTGYPIIPGTQLYLAVCFAVAAVAFAGQASRREDELLRWMAPACILAAFASLNYALFPSIFSEWLYTGDFLRTGYHLLLLTGAAREIHRYWTTQAESAVMADRRRLARELHDGVVQEVGYIKSEMHPFRAVDGPRSTRILGACDRALDEARQAIEAMGTASSESLGLSIHRAARQVADRYDVAIEVEIDDTITATPDQHHALLRIVREAISNAARHGNAERVRVGLEHGPTGNRRLVVADDGSGFDVARAAAVRLGFGITSMRERAENLPGNFHLESGDRGGTTVTVGW